MNEGVKALRAMGIGYGTAAPIGRPAGYGV